MMEIISHRINSVAGIASLGRDIGIEVDVRYHEDELILHHDPFSHHLSPCTTLEEVVSEYTKNHRGIIILNTKTEGVEEKCVKIMKKYNYDNWFFLDLSVPSLVKCVGMTGKTGNEGGGVNFSI